MVPLQKNNRRENAGAGRESAGAVRENLCNMKTEKTRVTKANYKKYRVAIT